MSQTDTIAPELVLVRSFDASPATVFDAWLSKSWGEWVGPPGIRGEVTLIEPHVGGRYQIVMHRPDGGTLTVSGTYREISRPNRLMFSWKWEHEEQETFVTLIFRDMAGKTELTLKHEGFANTERRDNHKQGWTGTLEKLGGFLTKL
ncbi:MAG TPA: SRPBCC domain-containing protein [Rhizomicrobium sp.]|jgi:uncharacterized protein YndB with AHSA1/START domain